MLQLEKLDLYIQGNRYDYEITDCIENVIKLNPNYTLDDLWNLINRSIQSLVAKRYWFTKAEDVIFINRRNSLQYIAKIEII